MAKRNVQLSGSDSPNGNHDSGTRLIIRELKKDETEKAAQLIARLKRLNGEFDPLLKTTDSLEKDALKAVEKAVTNNDSVVLVAVTGAKFVGVVKADIKDRTFYEPRLEGAIVEFYILPEFRRGSLGKDLLSSMTERLKKKGAELITAEFPSQNEIAKRFYTKLGFRSLTNVYAKAES
jgi:ribosomal protein S18 acetylase RimI-like enzyme